MESHPDDLELRNHATFLIYPFLHDITARNRPERLKALEPRWRPWWARLTGEQIARALDDTCLFLPYIREVIFPETTYFEGETPGDGYANWVAKDEEQNDR